MKGYEAMTNYGRSYTPPVFHTEKASTVQRDGKRKDELVIKGYGDFDLNEKGEILAEVVEMYMDDKTINHISME